MSYQVEITQKGRGGHNDYVENGRRISFDWDFSADGVEIYVPSPTEWDSFCNKHDADWAKGRRQEILRRLAEEVRRQKVKSAEINIEDRWIVLTFKEHWLFSLLRKIFRNQFHRS